jgi:FKBP-type peptidyl-prolyl cis-trans isomerase
MATTKGQRIGIWIIAVFMAIGTIGSFAIIILSNKNSKNDQAHIQALTAQYQSDVAAQTKQLSDQYYSTFQPYASRPAAFDAKSVTTLKTEDLVAGTGDTLTATSSFTAYYLGWTPDGKVFDGSISGDSLKQPFNVTPGSVIKGWTDGVVGMKVGGIRELTIPSDQAYGSTGSGSSIPPNTPIKFVVFVIPTPTEVPVPQELIDYYQKNGAQ